MKKLNLGLSIAAGLCGGLLSHYAWSQPVHADASISSAKEVRAQNFVLVDEKGTVQGVFTFEGAGPASGTIRLLNAQGREIWRAGGNGLQLVSSSTNRR